MAAERVASIRGDRCGAVRLTHSTTRFTTYTVECEVHCVGVYHSVHTDMFDIKSGKEVAGFRLPLR